MLDRTPVKTDLVCEGIDDKVNDKEPEGVCKHCGATTTIGAEFCDFYCALQASNKRQDKQLADLEARLEGRMTERFAEFDQRVIAREQATEQRLSDRISGVVSDLRNGIEVTLRAILGRGLLTESEQREFVDRQRQQAYYQQAMLERQRQIAQHQQHDCTCTPSRSSLLYEQVGHGNLGQQGYLGQQVAPTPPMTGVQWRSRS